MSDDTRDIAIETRAEVKSLTATVEKLATRIEALHTDLNERKGAEKLARTIHTLFGGAAGALVVKGVGWIGALPK